MPEAAGVCRFCGQSSVGQLFQFWVKPTFTDFDKLLPGEIICDACLFWFQEQNTDLAERMGKDKPQRMRNYSHFIVRGEWTPLSKAHKNQMRALLLMPPFPELAVIADSGQKHLVFRASRNPPGSASGWAQFEEVQLWVDPPALAARLAVVDQLYETFSKAEIETGAYISSRIQQFGVARWIDLESRVRLWRGQPLFSLVMFLTQRIEDGRGDERSADDGCDLVAGNLAGHFAGAQEPLSDDDLGAVRE